MYRQKLNKSKEVFKVAAEISKTFYHEPLIVTYSGGKDSSVIVEIAKEVLNNSDFVVVNSWTTVDAPETCYFIRDTFKELETEGIKTQIIMPKKSMWTLIVENGIPPTRTSRYCCKALKETTTPNRIIATGVRAAESTGRQGRDSFSLIGNTKKDGSHYSLDHAIEVFREAEEAAYQTGKAVNEADVSDCQMVTAAKENKKIMVNPIYDWEDSDVWEFIREEGIKVNPLYERGYSRVGCVLCPMSSYKDKCKEIHDFPKYKDLYIMTFDRMLKRRRDKGLPIDDAWINGEAVFDWWIEKYKHEVKGQMNIGDWLNGSN